MRTSVLVTISLPPAMAKASERAARKRHMTRSEIMRAALRRYLEEQSALEAVNVYNSEKTTRKLKNLKSLSTLMR